jgi:hypothetical protein
VTSDSEWYGEPHTLTVSSVRLPVADLDDGELEYEITHPPSCKQEERRYGDVTVMEWVCDVAGNERECGLPFTLRHSGTPVTQPGTYRIQGWGTKTWYHEHGAHEYDGGVAVMSDEDAEETP